MYVRERGTQWQETCHPNTPIPRADSGVSVTLARNPPAITHERRSARRLSATVRVLSSVRTLVTAKISFTGTMAPEAKVGFPRATSLHWTASQRRHRSCWFLRNCLRVWNAGELLSVHTLTKLGRPTLKTREYLLPR